MTKVVILLSTWNGVQYLPTQLESLFAQEFPGELSILIRDDGSTDGTIEYLESRNDPRIHLIKGENLGPRASFFELIEMAKTRDGDFFALCDQDDFWHPGKIKRAIAMLSEDAPSLYASSLDLVDEDLKYIGNFVHPGNRSFVSTLVCNFVTGCTCVFNRAFLDQMIYPPDAERTIMHDWWLASVATLGSHIVYDRQSFIGYRQHSSNHVGLKLGFRAAVRKVWLLIGRPPASVRFDHARQLVAAAGDRLQDRQRRIIAEFLSGQKSWFRRLEFVVRHRADIGMRLALRFVLFR